MSDSIFFPFRIPKPQNASHGPLHSETRDEVQGRIVPLGEEALYRFGQPAWRLTIPATPERGSADVILFESDIEMLVAIVKKK